MTRLIDADAFCAFLREVNTRHHYETLLINKDKFPTVADVIEAICCDLDGTSLNGFDNAPTVEPMVEPRIEYGTDGQPYRLFMSGGKVVPELLQGGQYEGTPKGEWISGRINSGDGTYCKCSICNFVDYSSSRENTCPNCKSPMKGGSII